MPRIADDPRYPLRSELLLEAERIITKDRNKTYGEPDEDFQRIARLASAWGFRVDSGAGEIRQLTGSDVAVFMQCLKLARLAWMPTHRDSWMDMAGYAGCGFETAMLERSRQIDDPQEWRDPNVVLPTKLVPIPVVIDQAAQKAAAGDPKVLESLGYILGDANPKLEECGVACDKEHTFRPLFGLQGCQYRIKRRRDDG